MMGTFALVSFIAGPLYNRVGPKVVCSRRPSSRPACCCSRSSTPATTTARCCRDVRPRCRHWLLHSSVTTAGITALDESRTSLAGGIVYMFQIAGGSIGLGINTAIVASSSASLGAIAEGIPMRSCSTPCSRCSAYLVG